MKGKNHYFTTCFNCAAIMAVRFGVVGHNKNKHKQWYLSHPFHLQLWPHYYNEATWGGIQVGRISVLMLRYFGLLGLTHKSD